MEKNTYPSYSVYIQESGQLKNPTYGRRVQIFDLNEARIAMCNLYNKYKSRRDVVLLRYDGPYDATIIQFIPKEKEWKKEF